MPYVSIHPFGETSKSRTGYKGGKTILGNSKFPVELISLNIQDFDIILGMDFLTKFNARINYQTKIFELQSDNGVWERWCQGNQMDKSL